MSHLELEHHVSLTITSIDSELLDSLESELPEDGDSEVGAEYDGPNRTTDSDGLEDGEERLTARVTLQTTYDENGDVSQYAETYAQNLYDALTGYDLSGTDHTVRHYRSPTGGVAASAVRAYYKENPDEQPVDEDGEAYVPDSFDPTNHFVAEDTG